MTNQNNDRVINVYFCGGQSNTTEIWYKSIKSKIMLIDPTAIILYNNHSGDGISEWYDGEPKQNYFSDLEIIKNELTNINYDFQGLFWFQGEGDSIYDYYLFYEGRFISFIDSFKEELCDNDFNIYMNIIYINQLR